MRPLHPLRQCREPWCISCFSIIRVRREKRGVVYFLTLSRYFNLFSSVCMVGAVDLWTQYFHLPPSGAFPLMEIFVFPDNNTQIFIVNSCLYSRADSPLSLLRPRRSGQCISQTAKSGNRPGDRLQNLINSHFSISVQKNLNKIQKARLN